MQTECGHELVRWSLAPNDDGWSCESCEKKLGKSQELDDANLEEKVGSILFWLHEMGVVYVSNSTEGDITTSRVMGRLTRTRQRDIVKAIIDELYGDH